MTFPCDAQLWVRFVDGRTWELTQPLCFFDESRDWTIEVPAGFITDFASIPRAVWPLIPKTGKSYTRAAVLHDYLYRVGEVAGVPITRGYADGVLLHAMEEDGARWLLRRLIYRGVRVGGWVGWRRHRKEREE